MIYGVGLASIVRSMRKALQIGNRNTRRRLRSESPMAAMGRIEPLEDRCVPATFFWTGGGQVMINISNQEFFTNVGINLVPPVGFTPNPSVLWSDPRNWKDGIVPSGPDHDLVFDYRNVTDIDSAPGTTHTDGTDSNQDLYGSFYGFNDLNLGSVRSITIISSASSPAGSSWEFKLWGNGLQISTQSGLRVVSPATGKSDNIVNLDLTNANSANGFNISLTGTAGLSMQAPFLLDPMPTGGNLQLQDPNNNVGGVLTVDTVQASASVTLNGAITGAGVGDGSRLFKTGQGRLTIGSAFNTYNGLTTIDQGTVVLQPDATLGNTAGDTILKANAVSPATLLLTASFVDPFGVEHFARVPVGEDLYMESGTRLQGQNNSFVDGKIFLLGPVTIEASDDAPNGVRSQFTIAGQITDGNFQQNHVTFNTGIDIDSYILLRSTLNNYSGDTIVTGERLLKLWPSSGNGDDPGMGTSGVIPNESRVILTDKAALDLNDFLETIGSLENTVSTAARVFLGVGRLTTGVNNLDTTFSGRISSAVSASGDQGGITKTGAGVFTLSGNNTYTGRTIVRQGTLRLGAAGVIDDNNRVRLENQAVFDLNNFSETIGSLEGGSDGGPSTSVLLGTATLTVGGNDVSTVYDGVISGTGGLTKRGAGTLGLGGANTYTGATAVIAGTLQLKDLPQRLSTVTAVTVDPGATLDLTDRNHTIGSLAGGFNAGVGGSVLLGSATLTVGTNNFTTVYRGTIAGTGGLTKVGAGTLTLLNPGNVYTGATTVNAGTLRVGDFNNPFGLNGAITSPVTVKSGATLAGDGIITGNVVVEGGGKIAPSNPLVVHPFVINGDLQLQPNATYEQAISNQSLYSRLTVTGTVNLGAGTSTLTFIIGGGYVPVNLALFGMINVAGTSPPVNGFFAAGSPAGPKPSGSYILVGGNLFRITYDEEFLGGAGNDVVLRSLINNAPVITDNSNVALTPILEDAANPAGDLISSFATPRISDGDFAAQFGIAIFATSQILPGDTGPLTGTWQYFNGSTWVNFGAVSNTSALLLPEGYSVRFVPDANRNGRVGFSFRAWDQTIGSIGGRADLTATGTGGATAFSSASILATLDVIAVVDNPVIVLPSGPLNYTENSGLQILDAAATLADDDAVNFNGGQLTVSFAANGTADDNLIVRSQGNVPGQVFVQGNVIRYSGVIVGTFAGGTGGAPLVVTFNASANLTAAQAVLRNIGFRNDSDFPSVLPRTVQFVMTDGAGGVSAPALMTVNVIGVNDAPVLTVPAAFFNTNENQPVVITGISVADVDAGAGNLQLTLVASHGTITINTGVAGGLTAGQVTGNGTATVVLTGTLTELNTTLAAANGVTYLGNLNYNGADVLQLTLSDLGNSGIPGPLTHQGTVTVVMAPVNSAPVNTLPAGPLAAFEDIGLVITGVSVFDADAGNGPIIVSFTVLHGLLFFSTNVPGGVPANQINGNGTASVTFAFGTQDQVNATLAAGFTYVGKAQVNVTDTLTMFSNDLGNTGAGGQLTDTDSVNILVTAVNDAPVNVMPSSWEVFTNTDTNFNTIYSNDVDALDGVISVTMSVVTGTLQFNGAVAPSVFVTGNGSHSVQLVGTQANINLVLETMLYRSALNFVGTDTLTMLTNDNGNSGIGGPLSTQSTMTINVKQRSIGLPGQGIPKPDIVGRLNGQWWVADSTGTSFVNRYHGFWSTTINWVDVNVADLNGDGLDDVIGRDALTGAWWAGISTGANSFVNVYFGAWSPVAWSDVRIADVNGDGLIDVVGRETSTGNWYAGFSTGTGFINRYLGSWSKLNWVDVLAMDVNGDGKTDVVGRDAATGVWWAGISNGVSFANKYFGAWSPGVNWVDVKAADVNGDGVGDILGRDAATGLWWSGISNTQVFINQYMGQWTPTITWIDVLATDLNNDDRTDVVGRDAATGQWWAGISNGSTFTMSLFGAWSAGAPWVDVQVIDVNADGRLDVVGRLQNTGDWWVARSNGTSFTNVYFGRWSANQPWVDVKVGNFGAKTGSSKPVSGGSAAGVLESAESKGGLDSVSAFVGRSATKSARKTAASFRAAADAGSGGSAAFASSPALDSSRIDVVFSRPGRSPFAPVDLLTLLDDIS